MVIASRCVLATVLCCELACNEPPRTAASARADAPTKVPSAAAPGVAPKTLRDVELRPGRVITYPVDCRSNSECALVSIPTDCCGSQRIVGVRSEAKERLEAELAGAQLPAASCECLASPSLLDDGRRIDAPDQVQLECQAGQCTTSATAATPSGPSGRVHDGSH